MSITFHFRARAIITSGGAVLATRHKRGDYTFLPGGHVELGESISAALLRELREELGKEGQITKYLGAIEQSWSNPQEGQQCEVNHIFACDVPGLSHETQVAGLEKEFEFFWLTPEEFEAQNLLPVAARALLKKYLAGDASIWWASDWET